MAKHDTTRLNDPATDHDEDHPDDRTPVLEVRDASVTFDLEHRDSHVLDDVSIDIYDREILGVVGESGSGKSMLASALLDAIPQPGLLNGGVTYYREDGERIDLLDLRPDELRRLRWEEIAMVFQGAQSSFNPTITIRDHFEETLEAHDYELESGLAHARQLLSDLYMDPDRVLESYPHELSGGMQQRTLIALSLVLEPRVLVMDEPTAALDLLMQRSILSLLDNIKEKYDLTVVFITHDLPLVAGLADRLAVLYAFEIVEVGSARELFTDPAHPYTRSLLKAIPNLETPRSEMQPIEGSSPAPTNVPTGCSYHPRCSLADEQCRSTEPDFHDVGGDRDHRAACFHWERSADEIPLSTTDEGGECEVVEGEQSDEPVVSVEGVDVHFEQKEGGLLRFFEDPQIVHAVDDATLDVYENDVVALVGESGCGKTTLGKTIIGAQRPTGGSVKYRDQDIWEAKSGDATIPYEEIRRSLQMIHQDPGSSLNPNLKIQSSIEEPLKRWKPEMSPADHEARALSMLEYVGMSPAEDYAQRYPHQLSGGEQQRVALIRALLMSPDVILADEAVSALDVSLRIEMMDLMLELQEHFDTSYVFISHNLSNARYFAGSAGGRIGVMYLGEIVELGPVDEVIENPKHPYTKVLKWATDDLELEGEVEEPPLRDIDIPDPVDPPSGCRFHTRCPEAREICRGEDPTLEGSDDGDHHVACFREHGEDHPYWESEPIVTGETDLSDLAGETGGADARGEVND
ncbi:ABC transporter ATP-binding protein [Halomontanus rarus]|uniref:ABC transporter ATP-binding protein n=1 Tax=Halomontanus rarus TaxID=3034020 RepID=UPI0023E89146|nr:ABC transporter ATP-binding protein [Halovivax sp. TS33]